MLAQKLHSGLYREHRTQMHHLHAERCETSDHDSWQKQSQQIVSGAGERNGEVAAVGHIPVDGLQMVVLPGVTIVTVMREILMVDQKQDRGVCAPIRRWRTTDGRHRLRAVCELRC